MTSVNDYAKKLKDLRASYVTRIDAIHKDTHHEEQPVEKDFAEQVVQRENDEVLEALDDDAKHVVMQIDNALLRIASDEFGVCQKCGEEIPNARLEVVPYTMYCVSCAEKENN